MKLKLEVLDTYNNLCLKFQNCLSSFGTTKNFVNLVALLESQLSSAIVLVSKIHIKLKTKSNLMKKKLFNNPCLCSFQKDKVLLKNHS